MFLERINDFTLCVQEPRRIRVLARESLALRSEPVTFVEFVLRGSGSIPWQSVQNSSNTICPRNLCDAGESQAFLGMIYTAVNNPCRPLLAAPGLPCPQNPEGSAAPRLEHSGHVNCGHRCVHGERHSVSLLLSPSGVRPQFVFTD